ncbi:MAG TPA: hypothetical protein VFU21_18830 [Kofleriaceae bacterium]|nr:hypothetical protein [Kofleriaceae bacterium]
MLGAAAPALLLVAVSLWEIALVARSARRAADPAEWSALATALRSQHAAGELIVFAPAWIDPLGRREVGDLIPIDMAARMDAARYGVVWEVSQGGARAPETEGMARTRSQDFGRLTLNRYQRTPADVATDFVAAFPTAKATGGRAQVSLEEVGFAPHRCVRAVPPPDRTIEVAYPSVELGRELVGYVGLADVFTRRDIRDPGELTVTVDGAEVARVRAGVGDGWVRFAVATEPRAGARVVFAARAVGKNARDRRICFAAEARR